MTYETLLDWYEQQDVESMDIDEFGDFTEFEIEEAILDFGVSKGRQDRDIARRKLQRPIEVISPEIFGKVKDSRRFITQVVNIKDLKPIKNLIEKDIQAPLSTRIGIERAKGIIKKDRFSNEAVDAVEFLRKYSPVTLGGLTVQQLRREKNIRAIIG